MPNTTVTVVLEVEVNESTIYGAGDAYDRAEVEHRRSLVADVEDYIRQAVADSAASNEGAFVDVELTRGGEPA